LYISSLDALYASLCLFTFSNITKTYGNLYKLIVPKSKIDARAEFNLDKIITVWNKLPREVVNAQSFSAVNDKLDKIVSSFATVGHL